MTAVLQYEIRRRSVSDIAQHLPRLHETALSYPGRVIIELGVRTGNSTAAFLAAIEAGGGGHLWSADISPPRVPPAWAELGCWTMLTGDDTSPDVSSAIAEGTAPGADVLFIDTSHFYDHTMRELELYVPMVKPGGTVLMHDTEWQGFEVAKALDAFCPAHGLEWVNVSGSNGLGIIHIPAED